MDRRKFIATAGAVVLVSLVPVSAGPTIGVDSAAGSDLTAVTHWMWTEVGGIKTVHRVHGVPRYKSGRDTWMDQVNATERSAEANRYRLDIGVIAHFLRGVVHRPRRIVHTLLGSKARYLVTAGFIFSALAGVGGGLILNNLNGERNGKFCGWLLLLACAPLFVLFLLLGLP